MDRGEAVRHLRAIRGIGPWTAAYTAMRALGDPDSLLPGDVAVRHAIAARGGKTDARALVAHAERWRPWRSYATHHLWATPGASPPRGRRAGPADPEGASR